MNKTLKKLWGLNEANTIQKGGECYTKTTYHSQKKCKKKIFIQSSIYKVNNENNTKIKPFLFSEKKSSISSQKQKEGKENNFLYTKFSDSSLLYFAPLGFFLFLYFFFFFFSNLFNCFFSFSQFTDIIDPSSKHERQLWWSKGRKLIKETRRKEEEKKTFI